MKPTHVGFSQHQLTRQQQEWQQEPTPVGSSSPQWNQEQNGHHQDNARLPYEQWERDPCCCGILKPLKRQ